MKLHLNKRLEPNIKCLILRFLTPIAGLIDSLISICTFTLISSNFEFYVVTIYTEEFFKFKIKERERLKTTL